MPLTEHAMDSGLRQNDGFEDSWMACSVPRSPSARRRGFTLIELLVVLAILALLMTIAVPRFFRSMDQSKETVLRENLHITREVIDKFYGDNGRYPESLDELVLRRYLREIPVDPITESRATWVLVPPETGSGVYSIQSGAPGVARSGIPFGQL